MDQEIVNALRQAANDIKEGKLKTARETLVALLRENPEVDQAWYMLSFTVPVVERQIYALEQALKVNPDNEKALSRLRKLQGEPEPPKDAFSFKTSKREQAEQKAAAKESFPKDDISGDDLLSKRLLGGEDTGSEPAKPQPAPAVEAPAKALPVDESPVYPEPVEEEEQKPDKAEKYKKKVFGIRRGIFMLVILILIFLSLGILGYTPQIKNLVAGLFGGGTDNGTLVAGDNDSGADAGIGDATEEPSPTEGIDLPPVWTPTPTLTLEPTEEIVESAPQLSDEIIDFSLLASPDQAILSDFETIRLQLSSMMEDAEIPSLNSYLVTEAEIQSVLSEFARRSEYRSDSSQLGSFLVGLGLADSSLTTDSLIQNMWADPNGTLVFFDTNSVILSNFEVSQYQRFSYAKALVQNYQNELSPFSELEIFPMCSPVNQDCEILFAITKGEASFFADLWATEYMGETAFEEYSQEPVNYFTVAEDETLAAIEAYLAFPDDYGRLFVEDIFEEGGLETLNGVFLNLPSTTEQVMHPQKFRTGEPQIGVEPASVAGNLSAAWQQVFQGTLGEWKTYLLLTAQVDENARIREDIAGVAAAGWGGDYAQIFFRNSTQEYVVVAEWAWDAPADTDEFLNAWVQSVANRTGAARVELEQGITCYQSSSGIDCVFSVGRNVVWLHAPDQDTLRLLLSAYS